jgi:hypothetical protein
LTSCPSKPAIDFSWSLLTESEAASWSKDYRT